MAPETYGSNHSACVRPLFFVYQLNDVESCFHEQQYCLILLYNELEDSQTRQSDLQRHRVSATQIREAFFGA